MIVVTGGAGLIGSAVVRELNRSGQDDILAVDHLEKSDKWMNLRSLQFRQYMEKDDFASLLESQGSWIHKEDIQCVIHLGACSSTTEKDASYLIKNNYNYSISIAEFCFRRHIRLVYASSAATYGGGEFGFQDDEAELEKLRPLNMYGYSKHLFDLWMKRHGFRGAAGVKYFNVFGPNEYHKGEMQSLVLKAFRQITQEGKMRLFKSYRSEYPDGGQKRDFFYVNDAAKMTAYLALENKKASGIFNAGSGIANTWIDLAKAIFTAMNLEPRIEFIEMPENLRDRYQYYTCAPVEKIRGAGYREKTHSISEAVSNYVKEYLLKSEANA